MVHNVHKGFTLAFNPIDLRFRETQINNIEMKHWPLIEEGKEMTGNVRITKQT